MHVGSVHSLPCADGLWQNVYMHHNVELLSNNTINGIIVCLLTYNGLQTFSGHLIWDVKCKKKMFSGHLIWDVKCKKNVYSKEMLIFSLFRHNPLFANDLSVLSKQLMDCLLRIHGLCIKNPWIMDCFSCDAK